MSTHSPIYYIIIIINISYHVSTSQPPCSSFCFWLMIILCDSRVNDLNYFVGNKGKERVEGSLQISCLVVVIYLKYIDSIITLQYPNWHREESVSPLLSVHKLHWYPINQSIRSIKHTPPHNLGNHHRRPRPATRGETGQTRSSTTCSFPCTNCNGPDSSSSSNRANSRHGASRVTF